MKSRLRKFSLIHYYFISFFFCKKKMFYSENIQYGYNFYGTDLYVNVCRGLFRTESNIYGGTSLQKSQKHFIVDVRLGSKYASNIGLKKRFSEKV